MTVISNEETSVVSLCVYFMCILTPSRLVVTGPDCTGKLSYCLSGPFCFAGEASESAEHLSGLVPEWPGVSSFARD